MIVGVVVVMKTMEPLFELTGLVLYSLSNSFWKKNSCWNVSNTVDLLFFSMIVFQLRKKKKIIILIRDRCDRYKCSSFCCSKLKIYRDNGNNRKIMMMFLYCGSLLCSVKCVCAIDDWRIIFLADGVIKEKRKRAAWKILISVKGGK
jgi:hypothetical protein